MRKILSAFLIIIILCSAIALPANAISVNYCQKFSDEIRVLWYMLHYGNGELDAATMVFFSLKAFHAEWWNETINYGDETYEFPTCKVSEQTFENAIKKNFHINNMDDFKKDLVIGGLWQCTSSYDPTEKCYVTRPPLTVGGGSWAFYFYGYTVNDNLYTAYVYTVDTAYEKPDNAIEGVDYVIHEDSQPALIEQAHKTVFSFDGENIRYYSWEDIESIPKTEGMITPDTKVDISTESAPSSSQGNTTNQSQAKPPSIESSSNVTSGTNTTSSTSTQNTISSNQACTTNQSQTKPPFIESSSNVTSETDTTPSTSSENTISSSPEITSQISGETSSIKTDTETSLPTSDFEQTDEKSSTENGEESTVTNADKTESPKSNNTISIIIIAISAVVLLGGGMMIYFLNLKKKH